MYYYTLTVRPTKHSVAFYDAHHPFLRNILSYHVTTILIGHTNHVAQKRKGHQQQQWCNMYVNIRSAICRAHIFSQFYIPCVMVDVFRTHGVLRIPHPLPDQLRSYTDTHINHEIHFLKIRYSAIMCNFSNKDI